MLIEPFTAWNWLFRTVNKELRGYFNNVSTSVLGWSIETCDVVHMRNALETAAFPKK